MDKEIIQKKMTPTQTAQKLKEGCNNCFNDYQRYKCGNNDFLCHICRATLKAKKEEWQNEIEFLDDLYGGVIIGSGHQTKIKNRLELLKKAVEIANE